MRFEKGNKYGKGRPRDSALAELKSALANFKRTHDKSFIQFAIERAEHDSGLMVAILKKILPDLSEDKATKEFLIELVKYGANKSSEKL